MKVLLRIITIFSIFIYNTSSVYAQAKPSRLPFDRPTPRKPIIKTEFEEHYGWILYQLSISNFVKVKDEYFEFEGNSIGGDFSPPLAKLARTTVDLYKRLKQYIEESNHFLTSYLDFTVPLSLANGNRRKERLIAKFNWVLLQTYYHDHKEGRSTVEYKNSSGIHDFSGSHLVPSLIYFRRTELKNNCNRRVDFFKSLGFNKIALFYPVHYYSYFQHEQIKPHIPLAQSKTELYSQGMFSFEETKECLDKIAASGMDLIFVPHLESLETVASVGESSWRLYSWVPLDESYYNYSFGDFIKSIKMNPRWENLNLTIEYAAEIDLSLIHYPQEVSEHISRLRNELGGHVNSLQVFYSPNGDVHHIKKSRESSRISANQIDCKALTEGLLAFDGIAPSLYEQEHHFDGIRFNFQRIKRNKVQLYLDNFEDFCPEVNTARDDLEEKWLSNFSAGEFSLGTELWPSFGRLKPTIDQNSYLILWTIRDDFSNSKEFNILENPAYEGLTW